MRAIIAAVERFAIPRGNNTIQCDRCGVQQGLDRRKNRKQNLAEATLTHHWMCLSKVGVDDPDRQDLCPRCAKAAYPLTPPSRMYFWSGEIAMVIDGDPDDLGCMLVAAYDPDTDMTRTIINSARYIRPLVSWVGAR